MNSENERYTSISQNILAEVKEKKQHNTEYILKFGGRRLTLLIIESQKEIMDYLENTSDTPEIGSTTELYKAAKILLQRVVNTRRESLKYVMRTKSSSIREWAQSQGNEIFDWDSMEIDERRGADSLFYKTFSPENNDTV